MEGEKERMNKKKIIIASFFVAIMVLVPFTAVGTSHVKSDNVDEYDVKLEEESDQDNCITCNSPLRWRCTLLDWILDQIQYALMALVPFATLGGLVGLITGGISLFLMGLGVWYGALYVAYNCP